MSKEDEIEAMSLMIDDHTNAIQHLAAAMTYCSRDLNQLKMERLNKYRKIIEELYEVTHSLEETQA